MTFNRLATLACAVLGVASGAAVAQSKTWDFTDQDASAPNTGNCQQSNAGGSNGIGNVWSCSQQPAGTAVTLSVAAWNASSTAAGFAAAAIKQNGPGYGFGVGNAAEGGVNATSTNSEHAMDNGNGNGTDMLLLVFSGQEALNKVTLGWTGLDGDFQVLRWAGSSGPTGMSNYSLANATSSGWELVSTVNAPGGIDNPDMTYSVNGSGLKSSYWLISAFNSSFGGGTGDGTADSLKVLSVSAAASVAEPASLALVAVALGGAAFGGNRRRRQQRA